MLPHIAEEAIGHVTHKSGVVGVYDRHDYSGEVKTALAMWADHLLMVVNGGEESGAAAGLSRKCLQRPLDVLKGPH